MIVKDLLEYGASMEHKQRYTNITMQLFAIMSGKANYLNFMLEAGASMDYEVNNKAVDDKVKTKPPSIAEVHAKHERWRRLR